MVREKKSGFLKQIFARKPQSDQSSDRRTLSRRTIYENPEPAPSPTPWLAPSIQSSTRTSYGGSQARPNVVRKESPITVILINSSDIRELREFIRYRYKLDVEIWKGRNLKEHMRKRLKEKMEKSDETLKTIRETLKQWDKKEFFSHPHDHALFKEIKKRLLTDDKRVWKHDPPWNDPSNATTAVRQPLELNAHSSTRDSQRPQRRPSMASHISRRESQDPPRPPAPPPSAQSNPRPRSHFSSHELHADRENTRYRASSLRSPQNGQGPQHRPPYPDHPDDYPGQPQNQYIQDHIRIVAGRQNTPNLPANHSELGIHTPPLRNAPHVAGDTSVDRADSARTTRSFQDTNKTLRHQTGIDWTRWQEGSVRDV